MCFCGLDFCRGALLVSKDHLYPYSFYEFFVGFGPTALLFCFYVFAVIQRSCHPASRVCAC